MTVLTLVIDGRDVAGNEGQTILEVARENGVDIPTLCHLEGLSPAAACRLCVVEILGQAKLFAACVTKIEEGMQVVTDSEQLAGYRRGVIELLFTERNHVCAVCVANRHCELQDKAVALGVDHFDLPPLHPAATVDASHDRFVLDHNRCILCTRCVRVCAEIEGAHAWDVRGRGTGARLTSDLGLPWGESTTCTSCGKCVQVCPTGALFEKGRTTGDERRRRPYLPYLVARDGRH
jgi:bidirectional [NiFe] hydrogenase diaphorase subunit